MFQDLVILIINLENDIDRKTHCIQEFTKCNLEKQLYFIKATNKLEAQQLKYYYISDKANNNIDYNFVNDAILPTWGAVGTAISHTRCWDYIIENNYPYALICEDDIEIIDIDKFLFTLNKVVMYYKNVNYDGSLPPFNNLSCYKSFIGKNILTTIDARPIDNSNTTKLRIMGPFSNFHCYMINQDCCQYLLHKTIPITCQIDYEIGFIANKYQTNFLLLNMTDGGTKQSYLFYSNIQYIYLSNNSIRKIFNFIPDEACDIIYKYLPKKHTSYNYNNPTTHHLWYNNLPTNINNLWYNNLPTNINNLWYNNLPTNINNLWYNNHNYQ